MSNTSETKSTLETMPGSPAPAKLIRYTMTYRSGRDIGWKLKNFDFSGTLSQAIVRCRKYCERMNLKFLFVEPFLSNLDEDEKNFGKEIDG